MVKSLGDQGMGLPGRDIEKFRDVFDGAFAKPVHFERDFHPLRQFGNSSLHGTHFIPVNGFSLWRWLICGELFKDSIDRRQDMARLSRQAAAPIEG